METEGYVTRPDGHRLHYRHLSFEHPGEPGWVFLSGLRADMQGTKANFVYDLARQCRRSCLIFEHFGHGQSSGAFLEGTFSRWLEDAVAMIQELTAGPQVVMGSSLGGWLMMGVAAQISDRIQALVGIAVAPDFTDRYAKAMTPEQQGALRCTGQLTVTRRGGDVTLSRVLIEDGNRHLILDRSWTLPFPVMLIHGTDDCIAPLEGAEKLMAQIKAPFASLTRIQGGDHGLSRPADLAFLGCVLRYF